MGRVWTSTFSFSRCTEIKSCRLEGESSEVFPPGMRRTWVARAAEEPMRSKLQHDFRLAVNQAHRDAEPLPGDSDLNASSRAEKNRKRGNLPADLGTTASKRPQKRTNEEHGASQATKDRPMRWTDLGANTNLVELIAHVLSQMKPWTSLQ